MILPEYVCKSSQRPPCEDFIAARIHWHRKENLQNILCGPDEATQDTDQLCCPFLRSSENLSKSPFLKGCRTLLIEVLTGHVTWWCVTLPKKWTGLELYPSPQNKIRMLASGLKAGTSWHEPYGGLSCWVVVGQPNYILSLKESECRTVNKATEKADYCANQYI